MMRYSFRILAYTEPFSRFSTVILLLLSAGVTDSASIWNSRFSSLKVKARLMIRENCRLKTESRSKPSAGLCRLKG
jgi:hypothetical protein